ALSYGQRRLVLVARAFAGRAQVLLLDEVFNGLDVRAKQKLRQALEKPRGGHDWILTSHRPAELPANVTQVARMEAGRIGAAGAVGAAAGPLPVPPPQAGEGTLRRATGVTEGTRRRAAQLKVTNPHGTSSPPPLAGEGREGARRPAPLQTSS